MSARPRWGVLVASVLTLGACAKKMSSAPQSELASGAAAPADASEDLGRGDADFDTLQQELAHLRGELRAAGVVLDDDEESVRDEAKRELEQQHGIPAGDADDPARCQRICDLAEATCELHDRICALADDHAGEERYVGACSRADDDCRRASEACRDCST